MQITWLIASGQLEPGDRLPTVRRLAEHLSINLHTVRSAYQKLEMQGLVETRRGRGTHVLSFDPRLVAQAAGPLRSHTVGVIVAGWGNPFYHTFLRGVEEVAEEDQTLLILCTTHDDPGEAWRHFARLSAKQVDGILVVSHDVSEFLPPESQPTGQVPKGMPYVTVDWPDCTGYVVLADLEGAGYQATQHLLEHGHRRIGLITFAQDVANVRPVNAGYRRALQEAGIQSDPGLIARVQSFEIASGAEGARELLALPGPPTAIFAIADMLAFGALRAIKESGRRVPDDVALVGFNDVPLATLVDPPLTTVAAPTVKMGHQAMKMLRALIAGKPPSRRRVILPTSLVVRRSCGCYGRASQAAPKDMTVTFEGDQCTYDGPKKVPAGEITVTMDVKDQAYEAYAVYILILDEGKTVDDLAAWPSTDKPTWARISGWSEAGRPGQSNILKATVEEGTIYMACFRRPPEAKIGAVGPIEVVK